MAWSTHRLAARFLVCAALTACDDVVPQADPEDASVDAGLPACRLPRVGTIDWVFVEGGSFVMGIDDPRWPLAAPPQPVTVPSFFIARTEMRWVDYDACSRDGVCTPIDVLHRPGHVNPEDWLLTRHAGEPYPGLVPDDSPARLISEKVRPFLRWSRARLPSEAEWEYAARGRGRDVLYPWGDERADCTRAVMQAEGEVGERRACTLYHLQPPCSRPAGNTPEGLCDMAGNSAEWTADVFRETYEGVPPDGTPRTADDDPADHVPGRWDTDQVSRGGAADNSAESVSVHVRFPVSESRAVGLRPVVDVPPGCDPHKPPVVGG
ncbi:MAG: formylglycine-generating enzyme family protein [Myxococcales bacterium]|nr:formylglycine-generating enzyme family protein [Myxococcales bacterium]